MINLPGQKQVYQQARSSVDPAPLLFMLPCRLQSSLTGCGEVLPPQQLLWMALTSPVFCQTFLLSTDTVAVGPHGVGLALWAEKDEICKEVI